MHIQALLPAAALLALTSCASSDRAAPPPASPPAAPAPSHSAAPTPAPALAGIWLGTLNAGPQKLRLQLHLDLSKTPAACALDSLDQDAPGIPCTNVTLAGTSLSLDVPDVRGAIAGTVSTDGSEITATWTQGSTSLPLTLTRQTVALAPAKVALDPAMPPIDLDHLQGVLDADLAGALASGELAPETGGGVTIGVVMRGKRRVLSYGTAKPDSVFEIGSITKTFTGLALAQMVEQKKARLDEPVRALLPPGTVPAPASGAEITLLDLSAQRSGLPRMPDNFKPADPKNPYVDYGDKALFAFMAAHGVARPAKTEFGYSNLGMGLLGDALAHRAGVSWETLVRKEVLAPLGMRETGVALTPTMRARFIAGHDAGHKPAGPWDMDALVGAGGLRSTAGDMLTYLEAQLHPDHLPASARATAEGKTLPAAIEASHVTQEEIAGQGMHIALDWLRVDETGSFWHNGGTGGYSAFALFNPEKDLGVVVLCNTAPGEAGFSDNVGRHVVERLTGEPAVPLGPAKGEKEK